MNDNEQIFNQIFGSSDEDELEQEPVQQEPQPVVPTKRAAEIEEPGPIREPLSKLEQFRADFDYAKSSQKTKRSKKNAEAEISYDEIKAIISEMFTAARLDRDNMNSKDGGRSKAGLAKLTILPYLVERLNVEKLQESFLDAGLLGAFQAWLEPHDNGCMPLYDVKHTLLQIMLQLNVDIDHLRECNIGKIVHFYTLNKFEHPNIRKLAQQLKDKWSKPEKAEHIYEKDD